MIVGFFYPTIVFLNLNKYICIIMNWQEELYKQLSNTKICNMSRYEDFVLNFKTKEDAVKFYFRSISWGLCQSYPTLDFLRSEFNEFQKLGLYLDYKFDNQILSDFQVYALHNCSGNLQVAFNLEKALCPIIYVANGCDLIIEGKPINSPKPVVYNIWSYGDNRIRTINVDNVVYKIENKEME